MKDVPHVIVIGGGGTGVATAYDLALRRLRVTLLERGEITSGATGRHHGLFHSGARYVVKDPASARECIQENRILRRIVPGVIESNGGLFVALTDEDMEYLPRFLAGCESCGIPARQIPPQQALRWEPNLNPAIKAAVEVPDGSFDGWRLAASFLASAQRLGADVRRFHEVVGFRRTNGTVTGVRVQDHLGERRYELGADLVINAAGPWAGRVGRVAGVDVPLTPSPGVLVAVEGRLTTRVINHLATPGDGDILVPLRQLSVIGTTSWYTDDPDHLEVPEEHVELLLRKGAEMVPLLKSAPFKAAWSAARPLLSAEAAAEGGREVSRTFRVFDHAAREGVEGLVSVVGGKAITLRLMAEVTVDVVCSKLGLDLPCRTAETPLLPSYAFRG